MLNETLPPNSGENPLAYADRVGRWYAASVSDHHKKTIGQYLTPIEIAVFMSRLCVPENSGKIRVLDPGAGSGILSCALCETLAQQSQAPRHIVLEAFEADIPLSRILQDCLEYLKQWLQPKGIKLEFTVMADDFVMTYAGAIDDRPKLMPSISIAIEPFDIVISNPPYFKIPKSDPRAKAAALVVHGQPNIYSLFMAVSASLLKSGGKLVFITPRSYSAGPYFWLFRKRFFENMRPEYIHLFDSRRHAFNQDDILQENIILYARCYNGWASQKSCETVEISSSTGLDLLTHSERRSVPLTEVLDYSSKDKMLHIPLTIEDDDTVHIVRSWPGNLHAYNLEISTGPVIPFRAVNYLSKTGNVPETHAPLLWMQNVTQMSLKWPTNANGKEQYILVTAKSLQLLVPTKNYVLIRRFSAKEQSRRLTAAPLFAQDIKSPFIGLENHVNYIHRPNGRLTDEETAGLAVLFNSSLLDNYFRTYNGNTQVSATELRAMPLPELDTIIRLGKRVLKTICLEEKIDQIIEETLNLGIRKVGVC